MYKFAKATMPIIADVALLILGTATVLQAGQGVAVPEIDPTTGMAAFALVAGAVLVIRGRRKK
jgi:hypothetical protein